jgi:multicomponent Na+:H+ antiporter subunit A
MLLASLLVVLLTCLAVPVLSPRLGREAGWLLAVPLLAAAVLLVLAAVDSGGAPVEALLPWMPTLDVGLSLRLDGLSLLFSLLVLVIGAGVLVYSGSYLGIGGRHMGFYVLMTAFALAMLLLVLADDLVVLFVAWEATTLCSFFLIARSGPHAREPALRTLLVTAAGGLSLLGAVALIAVRTGTTRISEALTHPAWQTDAGFVLAAAALLAGAAFTKSAQFPFQSWLPDSMVAITPVSAYLHAAAMVKAGIYLLLRFSPVLADVPLWSGLLVCAGLLTALFGAAAALRRHDLKELLAYSTMSQLGLLTAMIGIGTPAALTAAVVHTAAHALFKSSAFMLVGVIDHEAGTRDSRELAGLRLRMPATASALVLACASMAGVPLLLGFVSKELMFTAFLDAPGLAWTPVAVTVAAALTSVLTLAYSARLVLGAFAGGRTAGGKTSGRTVPEAPVSNWSVPALAAVAGLAFGLLPAPLDGVTSAATSAAAGAPVDVHLSLWHGFNAALGVSALVLTAGGLLVLGRRRVDALLAPLALPFSGLAAVEAVRVGIIRLGALVGRTTGSRAPRLHLAVPVVCLVGLALVGVLTVQELPATAGLASRPLDWALVALVLAGVLGAVRARTRISAIVVTGVVGFAMTLWYFVLGAADVALTQLLVEILTVCVMVLLLRRLPARFQSSSRRSQLPAAVLAAGGGLAAALGVWALTGRREMSGAAGYYLREAEEATGGTNIVNTILVDFRALDTLGELTVLGVAGIALAALLHSRRPAPTLGAQLDEGSPLLDARENSVFVRAVTRVLGPVIVLLSLLLLLRGHYEPGGGFVAALMGGAGFALLYLSAPSDSAARVRWPYLTLIGAGVAVGVGTGFLGYLEGSFLTPLHVELLGLSLSTALVFDIGVYLGVIGIVLAAFNLLGRRQRVLHDDDLPARTKEVSRR